MARKISVTKDDILKAAFEVTLSEGLDSVTARKVAAKAGCSTQPIFRVYKSMDDVHKDVFNLAAADFHSFARAHNNDSRNLPFVGLGMSYIKYAIKKPELFRLLFLSQERYGMSLYELLNGEDGEIRREIEKAQRDGCASPENLFMQMWICIHGMACMSLTGDFDLSEEQSITFLKERYYQWKN
ncbi:MAG: TetR/AcrR family transcriptional regulator [Lachnospiraceae bacterium]|nr:TetR/AcrR family transcriptional regulator [Lachnospiraceae bacterium]